MLRRLSPMLFVLLWSTGFVGAKYGLPYAHPATFLSLRVLINLVIFMVLIGLFGRGLTTPSQKLQSIWVGMLVHGLYLGGVYYAIWYGFPAGLAALIVGLQPIPDVPHRFHRKLLIIECDRHHTMSGPV